MMFNFKKQFYLGIFQSYSLITSASVLLFSKETLIHLDRMLHVLRVAVFHMLIFTLQMILSKYYIWIFNQSCNLIENNLIYNYRKANVLMWQFTLSIYGEIKIVLFLVTIVFYLQIEKSHFSYYNFLMRKVKETEEVYLYGLISQS